MDLRKVMLTKARSCISLKCEFTYEEIELAVKEQDSKLKFIVDVCQRHPTTTLFVLHIIGTDDILVVFGNPITSLRLRSKTIQEKVQGNVGFMYVWCHSL